VIVRAPWLAPGRAARAVLAWAAAALAAALVGASLTVAFLLARESLAFGPFAIADWWIFLHLWRPLVIAGAILAPLFSAPFALAAVWLIRRNGWSRPRADVIAGALGGLVALAALLLVARAFGPMGDAS
jgi:hypothetical protein